MEEGLDHWRVGRWKERDRATRWEWEWEPRVCSFCGGVHPEDVLKLVREGWEVDPSTKRYKIYLGPPGTRTSQQALLKSLRAHRPGPEDMSDVFKRVPSVWIPNPPVKIYFQHFSQEQYDELREMVNGDGK